MNAKILMFVNCVEAIIYLLLYNLHDCTFKKYCKTLYRALFCVIQPQCRTKHNNDLSIPFLFIAATARLNENPAETDKEINHHNFESSPKSRPILFNGRRTTSMMDMRKNIAPKIILSNTARNLSTSYEAVDEFTSNSSLTDRFGTFSIKSHERFPFRHSRSNDETLRHSQSSDENLSQDGSFSSSRLYSYSCENLLSDQFYRTSSTGNRMHLKNSILTSSTHSLSEKNVRGINRSEVSI